jgi:prophage regulatory protein
MKPKLLRLAAVLDRTGISKSLIYGMIGDGRFPRQVPINARAVGWLESEVEEWIEARAACRKWSPGNRHESRARNDW